MATEIARLTGFGLVVKTEPDAGEGAAYERRVRDAARGPLAFYVELHADDRRESADHIQIATVGVDSEQAQKLRILLELVRDAHLRARASRLSLAIRIEPADPVSSSGSRAGILRLPQRALSIALPRVARQEGRELYTLILADFLREAITVPVPARR
jgi:hypothetical protein